MARMILKVGETQQGTVDGSEIQASPVEIGSLSRSLQGFIRPKAASGISTINSSNVICKALVVGIHLT